MRTQVLNTLKQGISRLRAKGGADPSTLYDLLNGYVSIDGSIQSRPGTQQDASFNTGTLGLCAFNGGLVVFCSFPQTITNPLYTCKVLIHPTNPSLIILRIHFAAPFLGHLYVVAEFGDGSVYHYWLLEPSAWQPKTVYNVGDSVQPGVPNGFYYVLQPGPNNDLPAWKAGEVHAAGDKIQPTIPRGYYFDCTNTIGSNPASGQIEPAWPTIAGGVVYEDSNTTSTTPAPPNSPTPPDPGGGRYGNRSGGRSGGIP